VADLVRNGGSEDGGNGAIAIPGGGDGLRVGDGGVGGVDDGEAGGSGRGTVEDFQGAAGGGRRAPDEADTGMGEDRSGKALGAGEGIGGRDAGAGEMDREGRVEEDHAIDFSGVRRVPRYRGAHEWITKRSRDR
jgi:hypothetical protein